jgi:HPt (histidine-containing phosphotransfer) domain-containing protein
MRYLKTLRMEVKTMNEQPLAPLFVRIDPELADLMPGYLANRRKDVAAIRSAVAEGNMETPRMVGHSMKGSGASYGFDAVTDIGKRIESAAREGMGEDVLRHVDSLEDYLNRVKIIND